MDKIYYTINDLVTKLFKDILYIEEETLRRSTFDNVTMTELHVIAAIGLSGNRTMTEIANDLHVTVGTLTSSISNLVKKDIAKRYKDEKDRRLVYIGLTGKGKVLFRLHDKFHRTMVENIVKSLDDDDQRNLVGSLKKLVLFIDEYEKELLKD